MYKEISVAILMIFILFAESAFAEEALHKVSADDIKVLKISPHDESAIIQTPDGKMKTIRVGESIGDGGRVTEIVKDRIVIEKGADTVIIRLENGKQLLQRVSKTPPAQPMPHGVR